jgi:ribosomal protein L34
MNAFIVAAAFVLVGEHVLFNADLQPQFTEKQVRETAPELRAGFARWAATPNGRRLIARFRAKEYEIVIAEDVYEEGPGRAPQPALATLVASSDHRARKSYTVIINPAFRLAQGRNIFPSAQPKTQTDLMAAAFAGEMLHVDFYSRGMSLPHHQRSDFQDEWRAIARELGYPDMKHEDDDERAIRYVGTR